MHIRVPSSGRDVTRAKRGKTGNVSEHGKIKWMPNARGYNTCNAKGAKTCNEKQEREEDCFSEQAAQVIFYPRSLRVGYSLGRLFKTFKSSFTFVKKWSLDPWTIFIPAMIVALDSSLRSSFFCLSLLNSSTSSSVSGPGIQSKGEYHRTKSSNKQPGFAA